MTTQQEIEVIYPQLVKMSMTLTSCSDTATDLVHDCILDFLKYPATKQKKIINDGKLKEYIYTMCKTQYNSSNSKYHVLYRESQILQYNDEVNLDEIETEEIALRDIDEMRQIFIAINACCNTYEKQVIVDRFVENKTYKEMAVKYDTTPSKITNQTKNIINKLKNYINGNL